VASEQSEQARIAPKKARELIASGEAQALDVRDDEEWGSGHIPAAMHFDPDDLEGHLDELPKEGSIIVVCARGERSAEVAQALRERDYEAASVEGGMEAWTGAQLPMQPGVDYEFEGPDYKPPGT
jgi:rhodanese-related sulfurtransferase